MTVAYCRGDWPIIWMQTRKVLTTYKVLFRVMKFSNMFRGD